MAAVKDALDPSWINAPSGVGPSYDAEELRRLQGYQLAGGATPGTSRTGVLNPRDLALSLSGSNVLVGAGGAVIGTAKGAYVCGVAATTTIGALLAADVTNPRRDRVVLEILDPDNGGGAGRKAQLRIIDGTPNASAATGGGFPAAPSSPFIDLGYADMPKSGGGNPSLTITAPITTAAGATLPVRTKAERDALPKWEGLTVIRLDLLGLTQTVIGGNWVSNYAAPFRHWRATTTQNLSGTGSTWSVNFPAGLFTAPPSVGISKASSAGAGFVPYVASVTTSAVVLGAYWQGNSTAYTGVAFTIDAVQMMPNSAGGAIGD